MEALDRMGRKDAELRAGLDAYDTVIVPASDLKTVPARLTRCRTGDPDRAMNSLIATGL